MADILIEFAEVDNLTQNQRLLCYYMILSKVQKMDFDTCWECFVNNIKKDISEEEKNKKLDGYINAEILSDMYSNAREDVTVEEQEKLIAVWDATKNILKKEQEWEQKVYQTLEMTAVKHPLISRIIVAVLTGVLTGLLANCVYDAWTEPAGGQGTISIVDNTNIYLQEKNNEYVTVYYLEDGVIQVKNISKNEMELYDRDGKKYE